ncbi:glycosyltransferase [Novipirellula artificiosorum]|uniref:2-deoxystreptamine glucosyltransferase n=1 Tax=Novipirellula artificiosorum TaxID=2528016 RepID=A0A5C6DVU7_9BACT|nr:glycosyltransferase [Novipirellula artificiosorum]TWU40778.1 2-deoxystreptamine glucosyltransferase [Novipirellula artificiosorum]
MRIALIITELNPGGAERCLTELAIGLTESGDDVRVYSIGSRPDPQKCILIDRLAKHRVPIEYGGADSTFQVFKAQRSLRKSLHSFHPALAQTFLYHANVVGTWAARAAGVAVRVGGIRVAEARPLRCRLERFAVKQMQQIVCVSEDVRRFAASQLAADQGRLSVIPNAVDTTRFSTTAPANWRDHGWPEDSIVTLFVGRMHAQKGLETIRQQIDRLAPAGSNRRVLLIGEGPLENEMDAWIRSVGADRIQRLGWTTDVAPFIKASRLLLLPSHYEGMPNVVMEAMASGRPVVCSSVEGTRELLAHAPDGQCFDPGDSGAMANAVERFLNDRNLSEQIGFQNQTRMRNDFAIPTMIDRYRSLYRSLTGEGAIRSVSG